MYTSIDDVAFTILLGIVVVIMVLMAVASTIVNRCMGCGKRIENGTNLCEKCEEDV
jgi:hypothetical protein